MVPAWTRFDQLSDAPDDVPHISFKENLLRYSMENLAEEQMLAHKDAAAMVETVRPAVRDQTLDELKTELKKEFDDVLEAVKQKFDKTLTEVKTELAEVKHELAEVKAELAEVKKELAEAKKERDEARKERDEVKAELAEAKKERDEALAYVAKAVAVLQNSGWYVAFPMSCRQQYSMLFPH